MKLEKISLKRLCSFRKEVNLDFLSEPLAGTTLFAICGHTGAGKTTILDAICAALYNKTPRLGTGPREMLSQGEKEGMAEVQFRSGSARYLARWRVKRPRSGEPKIEHELHDLEEGRLLTARVSSKSCAKDFCDMSVSDVTTRILGLDFESFVRSVMLAQGEFAAFLKARPEERRQILETTTGLALYEKMKWVLKEKVKDAKAAWEATRSKLEVIPEAKPEEIHKMKALVQEISSNLTLLEADRKKMQEERDREKHRAALFSSLESARKKEGDLRSREAQMKALEGELLRAKRALLLRGEDEILARSRSELEKNRREEEIVAKDLKIANARLRELEEKKTSLDEELKNAKKDAEEKGKILRVLREKEILASKYGEDLLAKEKEIEAKTETLRRLKSSLEEKTRSSAESKSLLKDAEQWLKENPLPEDAEAHLSQISSLVAQRRDRADQREARSKVLDDKEKRRDEQYKSLKTADEEARKLQEHLAQKEVHLARLDAELQGITKMCSLAGWEERREVAQRVLPEALRYEQVHLALVRNDEEIGRSAQIQLAVFREMEEAIEREGEIRHLLARVEDEAKRLDEEKQTALLKDPVMILRRDFLKAGQACPVCGSLEHPLANEPIPEGPGLKEIERALEGARKEQKILQKKASELAGARSALEEKHRSISENRKKMEEIKEELRSEMESALKVWRDSFPEAEPSSVFARKLYEQAGSRIKIHQELERALYDLKGEMDLLREKIRGSNQMKEQMERQMEVAREEILIEKAAISSIDKELCTLGVKIQSLLPQGLQGFEPQNVLEAFGELLRKRKETTRNLEELRAKVGILEAESRNLQEQIDQQEEQIDTMKSEGTRLSSLIERERREVLEGTDGLGVERLRQRIEQNLKTLTGRSDALATEIEEARSRYAAVKATLEEKTRCLQDLERSCQENLKKFREAIQREGFISEEEYSQARRSDAWMQEAQDEIDGYTRLLHAVVQEIGTLEAEFREAPFDSEALPLLDLSIAKIEEEIRDQNAKRGALEQEVRSLQECMERRRVLQLELDEKEKEKSRWERLEDAIGENVFRDFALEATMGWLMRFAGKQLYDLTGRYTLRDRRLSDIVVVDNWNAGEERRVETLSGGESFLASLSLALALSEMSRGRATLESLFLDEGFGTLDQETLEVALAALEGLRHSGRTVGVISHIPELTRRIPVRIQVRRLGSGISDVTVEGV